MTDLDAFRAALHAEPDQEFRALDLDQVMATGGRIRRRRRALTAVAAAGVTAVVLVAVVAGGGALATRGHRPGSGQQPGGALTVPPRSSGPLGQPDPYPSEDRTPVGEVIPAGTRAACGDLVFWLWRVSDPGRPKTTFALTAGCRTAEGGLEALVTTGETEGSDTAPGFHAVQGAMNVDGVPVPTFGYYVGPVATITATAVGGQPLTAHRAPWSADPQVVVFWFDTTDRETVTGLTARDADGDQLPAGDTRIGVG